MFTLSMTCALPPETDKVLSMWFRKRLCAQLKTTIKAAAKRRPVAVTTGHRSISALLGRLLEVSGFHECHRRHIHMSAHGFDDLLGRQGQDLLLQISIPCHGPVVERQRPEPSSQFPILRAADLLCLHPAIFSSANFGRRVTVLENDRYLVTNAASTFDEFSGAEIALARKVPLSLSGATPKLELMP
jgi:hypothetical protein